MAAGVNLTDVNTFQIEVQGFGFKGSEVVGSVFKEFRGSMVQGSIRVPGPHLGCVFRRKASASSGLIPNLEHNWQLFRKMRIYNKDFGSLMPCLSLTLNVEP